MDKVTPKNYYFTKEEQQAVIDYNNTTDTTERERIYNNAIHPALTHLVECIVRRFKFEYVVNESGERDIIQSTVSFLSTIINQYNIERGKAYSFFTFCAKNYLIQLNQKSYRSQCRDVSIDITAEDDRPHPGHPGPPIGKLFKDLSYNDPIHETIDLAEFLTQSSEYWDTTGRKIYCRKKNHHTVMDELIKLMKSPGDIEYSGNTKVGKKEAMLLLRNTTKLNTAKISNFLRHIKVIQHKLLEEYSNEGVVSGHTVPAGRWDWKSGTFVFTGKEAIMNYPPAKAGGFPPKQ